MRRWILIICRRDIFRKYGIERCHNFSYHLISVSALRCETGNTKITSFHVSVVCYFANKHTKTCQNITWSQTDCPSFTKKATVCIKHDRSIQPSDMHTLDIHHVAIISDTQSILGVLFRLALKFGEYNEWDILLQYLNICSQLSKTLLMTFYLLPGRSTRTSCMQRSQTAGAQPLLSVK